MKSQNNQKVMTDWHFINCNEIGKLNPQCRCSEPKHHVGAFMVAQFLGLTDRRNKNAE